MKRHPAPARGIPAAAVLAGGVSRHGTSCSCRICGQQRIDDRAYIEELVRTDYDVEAELQYNGKTGVPAAVEILGQWNIHDPGAAEIIDRIGVDSAAVIYTGLWAEVHAEHTQAFASSSRDSQ